MSLSNAILAMNSGQALRYATLWSIVPRAGITLANGNIYVTDHNMPITYDGNTYVPVGGMAQASARERAQGIRVNNVELRGYLSTDAITDADMRARFYADARITETLIDWRYPWMGALDQITYIIRDYEYNGLEWLTQLDGLGGLLQHPNGRVITKKCQADLGDGKCQVALAAYTSSVTVTAVTDDRLTFTATAIPAAIGPDSNHLTVVDTTYAGGLITWTGGNNDGVTSDVKDYTLTGDILTLELRTPKTIQVGDTFDIYPGCDKVFLGDCLSKFRDPTDLTDANTAGNTANFQGMPHAPGTDRTLSTPVPTV